MIQLENHLMCVFLFQAMDEPKQKKKEKPAKKNKEKAKEKKDRSATPTVLSTPNSVATSEAIEVNTSAASVAVKDHSTATKHHHDHVDFAEKEDVKLVELDQPPKVSFVILLWYWFELFS